MLGGCAAPLDTSAPSFPFSSKWAGNLAAPRLMDNRDWWKGLGDPLLDALIAQGLKDSPSLGAARERAAAAQIAAGVPASMVQITGGLGARASSGSLASEDSRGSADVSLDLVFDPGRGREAERRGSVAAAAAAAAELSGARLLLIGEITQAYVTLRHDQRRLSIAHADRQRMQETLSLAKEMTAAGESTVLEVTRSQARLASIEASLPGTEAAVAKGILRVSVLIGAQPGQLPPKLAAALSDGRGQPKATLSPDPGLPSDLVRNRPDLRLAEARYDAARADLGRAKAALYPQLSLTGTIEARRTISAGRVTTGDITSFGPSLRLPAFPGAKAQAGTEMAAKGVAAAYQDWTAAVLNALGEVEAALIDYRAATRAEGAADRAVRLNREAREMVKAAVSAGELTVTDLFAADEALLRAEEVQAAARAARANAFVALNIRLGSGG